MSTYKFVLGIFAVCIGVYILLNLAWFYSSETYKPNHALYDTTFHEENLDQLWTVYRKGHTEKGWENSD